MRAKAVFSGQKQGGVSRDNSYYSGSDSRDAEGSKPESLIGMTKLSLEKGRPLVRVLYKDPRPGRASEEYGRLDALFLIGHLLRLYIWSLYGKVDTEEYALCLIRSVDGRPAPTCVPEGKNWNRQLLDRNFNSLVAADTITRGRYMLNRIVTIKTFWDISTNLRARRMKDILKTVWPEFLQTE